MKVTTGATVIIFAYNNLVARMPSAGRWAGLSPFSKVISEDLESTVSSAASEIFDWVNDRQIVPMAYLVSCFAKHFWRRRPPIGSLLKRSYQTYFERNRDDAYRWAAAIQIDIESTQSVDVPLGLEIVKKRLLLGGPKYCRSRRDITAGYNELSPLCSKCVLKEEC